ncbi:MAG: sigma-54 interaction domain-containing protein [Pirellula sp.]
MQSRYGSSAVDVVTNSPKDSSKTGDGMSTSQEIDALLSAWSLASWTRWQPETAQQVLELMRSIAPVQRLEIYRLDPQTKSLQGVSVADRNDSQRSPLEPIECSEAKWSELTKWTAGGDLVRQSSPKRSGKLAHLVSDEISNEAIALPLRSPNPIQEADCLGTAVLWVELGRSLRETQYAQLERWREPLWLLLKQTLEPERRERAAALDAPPGLPHEDPKSTREWIVGADSGLKTVMERVQLVAASDMPVLILGDTGTGKEVVARAIHTRSTRSKAPFLRVNCGAIPSELIDSQLFGHERGSFTGASDQRKGWFERAHGGTLFLDEIGELPLAAQVRLLRVLQEKQIERVGGQDMIHVDVRIIAATHRDLATMVHQRTFREDLWYRINMFPILLPRLSERIEDIPALARHFAKKAAISFGMPVVEPSQSDIEKLIEYHWPGNIRELQAVMDRAVILGRGAKLDIATALGIGIAQRYQPPPVSDEPTFYEVIPEAPAVPVVIKSADASYGDESRPESLNDSIKRTIERALVVSNGQIEGKRGAANALKINPHTLRAKMRKLGIRWSDYRRDDE